MLSNMLYEINFIVGIIVMQSNVIEEDRRFPHKHEMK